MFRYLAAQHDGRMGVSPPDAGATSQKKEMTVGCVGHCAISWWNGITSVGGASLAVKTPGATFLRGAAEHAMSQSPSLQAATAREESCECFGLRMR